MAETLPENKEILIPDELVMNQIYILRRKVMQDFNLLKLYGIREILQRP
jgi:hypothetical protein